MTTLTTVEAESPTAILPTAISDRLWRVMPDSMALELSKGTWQPAPHLKLLAYMVYLAHLNLPGLGLIRRITVNMPPGHGKTLTSSEWSPAWMLETDPRTRIILVMYGATLAEESGKNVRSILTEHRDALTVRLRQDSQAADRWRTTKGGGMWTAGIDGGITGRRARCLLIDDPHKNFEEAHSQTRRERVWNFYRSTARNRLLPGGLMVVTHTRWHEDDLTGKLQANGALGGMPWTHIRFPAIAEETETIETVLGERTVAALRAADVPVPEWHREEGQALWPYMVIDGEVVPWYDEAELADLKVDSGEYIWNGLYQQRPSSPTGSYFPVDNWQYADQPPARCRFVRRWDLAATEGGGDATTGGLVAIDDVDKGVYIVDIVHERLSAADVRKRVRMTAEADRAAWGKKVHTVIEQEPGSSGKALAEQYVRDVLAGFSAEAKPTTGDKEVNALPLASQQQAYNVYLCRTLDDNASSPTYGQYVQARWWGPYIEEARAFPNGTHDDQVDATSHAFSDLAGDRRRKTKASIRSAADRPPV